MFIQKDEEKEVFSKARQTIIRQFYSDMESFGLTRDQIKLGMHLAKQKKARKGLIR